MVEQEQWCSRSPGNSIKRHPQMNLKKIENASVIHIRQYRDWRNTGIAFEFGDQTYTEPNRTMASYTQVTVTKLLLSFVPRDS